MRDLERLKEVRNYRVTGPQLGSLFGLAALVVAAAFVAGFEVGLWQRPVDTDLLSPGGAAAEREAGEVLAALIAEREQEVELEEQSVPERMAAPPLSESLENIDVVPAQPDAALDEGAVEEVKGALSSGEPPIKESDPPVTLTVRDDTVGGAQQPDEQRDGQAEAEAAESIQPAQEPPALPVTAAVAGEVAEQGTSADQELPTVAEGRRGFTVQLAAYETSSEAGQLIKSLRAQGFEAFHQRAQVGDKTWYRVRVGLHPTRASAEKEAARLAKASPFTPYVTSHP